MKVKVYVVDFAIPRWVKRWGLPIGIPAVVLTVAVVAFAAPFSFTDGQTLTAAELNTNFGYLVPSGAVVAFDLSACPAGWAPFAPAAGMVVVGTSNTLSLGATVGSDSVALSTDQLPAHVHTITDPGHVHGSGQLAFMTWACTAASMGFSLGGEYSIQTTYCPSTGGAAGLQNVPSTANATIGIPNTDPAGGGNSFDNRQASIALLYCQKN